MSSSGGQSALLSYREGGQATSRTSTSRASRFLRRLVAPRSGPSLGTFPAFGLGWRITKEPFLENNKILTDAMLRVGYGVTGNQQIPSGRIVAQFGGDLGDTYYDITGSNSSIQPGFRRRRWATPT